MSVTTDILHTFLAENYRLAHDLPEDTHIVREVNEQAIAEAEAAIESLVASREKEIRIDEELYSKKNIITALDEVAMRRADNRIADIKARGDTPE